MEVHVELGGDITVQDGVDVLQVNPARINVLGIGLQVRSVPVATTTSRGLGLRSRGEDW